MSVAVDYAYLCCNCGAINRYADWKFLKRDYETDALVPVEPGDSDPICVCPSCGWEHVDDDSNPGIYDGSIEELTAERERLAADPVFADLWAENGHSRRQEHQASRPHGGEDTQAREGAGS